VHTDDYRRTQLKFAQTTCSSTQHFAFNTIAKQRYQTNPVLAQLQVAAVFAVREFNVSACRFAETRRSVLPRQISPSRIPAHIATNAAQRSGAEVLIPVETTLAGP